MNNSTFQSHCRRWLPVIALATGTVSLSGCASHSNGFDASRFTSATPLVSEKIFLGNDTISVRGIGASKTKELNRYTCGPNGMMICDSVSSVAMCSCYRK